MSGQPIAIFHYEFPFNDAGEQVWNWRHVECFTIEGDAIGALDWHIKQACDPECPANFLVEWLDANNGRTTTTTKE